MTADVTLDDRYVVENGRVYLTGIQALVRLPLCQRRRDRRAGLATAGFVSGYRGSPLGGYDKALWEAAPHLEAEDVAVRPAINEEMAATAIIGTQQLALQPGRRRDGVFAIWYGKGPGLDRAGDALKHGNSLGSSPLGGVLVVAGDDHGAVSSSMAHQSEQAMAAWMMPVLHPASVREYVALGMLGIAMSRFSGCWVGFKAVSETVESAVTCDVHPDRPRIAVPDDFALPPGGLGIRWPDPQLAQEERLHRFKLPAALAFARANRLDRVVMDAQGARRGIAAVGKAYHDLRQALDDLGIDDAAAARLGLRVYKVTMSWPLEPEGALAFARGLDDVLVIEEKRALVEPQLKELLYHLPADRRPRVHGKTRPDGRPLLPTNGEFGADAIARVLTEFLGLAELPPAAAARVAVIARKAAARPAAGPPSRMPWFCPGCPHNLSTAVPEGCRAFAGTGCHLMAVWMERGTSSLLHMGGEGANWVGMAPFTDQKHVFQNLGDGTYVHSGILAVRQAVAAGAPITFKILFNEAVAMTGGQAVEGSLTVPRLAQQLHHEGVGRIAVVSDAPAAVDRGALPPGVSVHGRGELDAVQRALAGFGGVSALIYQQECATAKRRRQRRHGAAPQRRVFINAEVCDGCGDCVRRSNCIAVVPVKTPLGTRRAIDQSACNADLACVSARCPAFVTVEGRPRLPPIEAPATQDLPEPAIALPEQGWEILVTGIGGTGVVTIGQLLGVAAHIEGKAASVLDFTGLSQKGGGVLTHLRLAATDGRLHSARVGAGKADLVLAGDLVVTTGAEATACMDEGRTRLVGNRDLAPTAAAVRDPDAAPAGSVLVGRLRRTLGGDAVALIEASRLASRLLGDGIFANVLLLGYAWQKGLVPLRRESIERAMALNGVSVAENRAAFAWGRVAAAAPDRLPAAPESEPAEPSVEERAAMLERYADAALARRFRAMVARAAEADRRLWGGGRGELTAAVARGYFRVLAPKDEYEVAGRLADPEFLDEIDRRFEPGYRLRFHLTPPWSRVKRGFGGGWVRPLRLLAALRRLRGGALDPFARGADRAAERAFRGEYEATLAAVLDRLDRDDYGTAVELAALPEEVRGYGPVKLAGIAAAREKRQRLLAALRPSGHKAAAE